MIFSGTNVKVVDKSGAKSALVIRVLRNLEIGYPGIFGCGCYQGCDAKKKKKRNLLKREIFFLL